MKKYANQAELIDAIQYAYQRYIIEFADIDAELKDKRIDGVDKTPSENLSYQLGWIHLLLQWEADEQQGKTVQTPSKDYKWNQLGALYQSFYQHYGHHSLLQQQQQLSQSVQRLCTWIASLTEAELFEPGERTWTHTAAKWPLYKWIHINTVAPFTNFRLHIRKWKKLNNHHQQKPL